MKYSTIFALFILFILSVIRTSNAQEAGNCLNFNGSSSYVMFDTTRSNYNFSYRMTVAAWVKWSIKPSGGNPYANILTINSNAVSDDGQFWLQHNSTLTQFEFSASTQEAGKYEVQFNAINLASGIYFYRIITSFGTDIKRLNDYKIVH